MTEAEYLTAARDWKGVVESGISFTRDAISTRRPVDPDAWASYRDGRMTSFFEGGGGRVPGKGNRVYPPEDPPGDDVGLNITSRRKSVSAPFNSERSKRSVTFSSVEVREHAYTLGYVGTRNAGGGVASLPPIELLWEAHTITFSALDDYEASRGRCRPPSEFYLSDEVRLVILKNAGYGRGELRIAARSEPEDVKQPAKEPLDQDFKQKIQDEALTHKKKHRERVTIFRRQVKSKVVLSLIQM
jgi:hypothetical protein